MTERNTGGLKRRQFLQLLGINLAAVSVAGLAGCSGQEEAAPAAAPTRGTTPGAATIDDAEPPATEASMEQPAAQPPPMERPPASAAAGTEADLPKLSVDDPQAKALGYKHDGSEVDQSAYARYEPGQLCSNCALFQGDEGDEWAGCSIFPGRAVNANGWCSAYVAKG